MKKYILLLIISISLISNIYAFVEPKFVNGGITFNSQTSIFYLKDGILWQKSKKIIPVDERKIILARIINNELEIKQELFDFKTKTMNDSTIIKKMKKINAEANQIYKKKRKDLFIK